MLADPRTKMSVRRIKELIAESEECLFYARKIHNRVIGWDDQDGAAKKEYARLWAESYAGRLFNLKTMLRSRGEVA